MCTWWRIAATAALVALTWPGLTFAQQDDILRQTTVARDETYAGSRAMTPSEDDSWWFAQAEPGHDGWQPVHTAQLGWPGFGTTALAHPWGALQGRWRFASLIDQTYAVERSAPVTDGRYGPQATMAAETTFVPVAASYRISSAYRIAFSWGVISPTVRYGANASGVWAMKPKVAYTRELSAENVDSSTIVAVGTFSREAVANYQNGAVGRVEALVMRHTMDGWGFGGVAAAIQPYNTMSTSLAGRPPNTADSGGYALGVGPQLNWSTRWMGSGVEFQYRWIHEFRAPNGHTDQPMLLSATLHL
jgi:hypothetical protein